MVWMKERGRQSHDVSKQPQDTYYFTREATPVHPPQTLSLSPGVDTSDRMSVVLPSPESPTTRSFTYLVSLQGAKGTD